MNNGAVIGGGVTIGPGVVIGENSVVGHGANITKNVPNNKVMVTRSEQMVLMDRKEYDRKSSELKEKEK